MILLSKLRKPSFSEIVSIWWMLIGFSFLFRIAWPNIFNGVGFLLFLIDLKRNGYKKPDYLIPVLIWFGVYLFAALFSEIGVKESMSGVIRELWRFFPFFIGIFISPILLYVIGFITSEYFLL